MKQRGQYWDCWKDVALSLRPAKIYGRAIPDILPWQSYEWHTITDDVIQNWLLSFFGLTDTERDAVVSRIEILNSWGAEAISFYGDRLQFKASYSASPVELANLLHEHDICHIPFQGLREFLSSQTKKTGKVTTFVDAQRELERSLEMRP